MKLGNLNLDIPISISVLGVGASAIIVWYLKYKTNKDENDEYFDVLWSNNARKCTKTEHNIKSCNKNCCSVRMEKIITLLNEAKYSIDIAMHILTLDEILTCFIKAHQRGVKIRILICESHRHASKAIALRLYDEGKEYYSKNTKYAGIEVHSKVENSEHENVVMHHKFCIIDGKNRVKTLLTYSLVERIFYVKPTYLKPVLLTGSCNWTHQGMLENWENIIITNNENFLDKYEKEFELIWKVYEISSKTDSKT